MRLGSRALLWLLPAAFAAAGCSCEDEKKAPPPAAPVASAAPEPAAPPPTEGKKVTFAAQDGVALAGDYWVPAGETVPIVVLVHSFRADRGEWAPLVEKLRSAERRFAVLALDLRGHGDSKGSIEATAEKRGAPKPAKGKKKILDWSVMGPEDAPAFVGDVTAAIDHATGALGARAGGVVLVGSSLSAAVVSKVAGQDQRVTAVALVSPGAAILGFDVYQPFADVRDLPAFLAGAEDDNVTREPLGALEKMAKRGTVKRYPGRAHSVRHLGSESPPLWDDLATWLSTVYELRPGPRAGAPGAEAPAADPGKGT